MCSYYVVLHLELCSGRKLSKALENVRTPDLNLRFIGSSLRCYWLPHGAWFKQV